MLQRRILCMAVVVGLGALAGVPPAARAAAPEFTLTIENHRFTPEEIRVKAGTPFVLVITNRDATVEEFESRELRFEKIVPAGKTLRLRLPALRPGTYAFIGEYHAATAKGRLVAE